MPQHDSGGAMGALFAEELGLVLEVSAAQEAAVLQAYNAAGVNAASIGRVTPEPTIEVAVGGQFAVAGRVQACMRCRDPGGSQLALMASIRMPWAPAQWVASTSTMYDIRGVCKVCCSAEDLF